MLVLRCKAIQVEDIQLIMIAILLNRRFSFAIKFDEKFDEDESVYSCVDINGVPASVGPGLPCLGIIGQNIPDYPEADDRVFMGVEKLRFRYNKHDPSYQREVLTHELMNRIGLPVARATHAQVELIVTEPGRHCMVNLFPQTYNMGVFTMVEQVDKPFLKDTTMKMITFLKLDRLVTWQDLLCRH